MFYGCDNLKDIFSLSYGSEIYILVNIEQKDIGERIYFLGDKSENTLEELNEYNTELYIDDIKYQYKKYFRPEKEGISSIILKFYSISIKNCDYIKKLYNPSKKIFICFLIVKIIICFIIVVH